MNILLRKHIDDIRNLCEINNVKELYAFGSVLTSQFNKDSDVDLLISIDISNPVEYAEAYFNVKFSLEEMLHRSIDLLEIKALKNQVLKNKLDKEKELLYANKSESLA